MVILRILRDSEALWWRVSSKCFHQIFLLVSVETHLLQSMLKLCYKHLAAIDLYLQVPLSISSILFLYLLLFPHDCYHAWAWFPVLFQYIVELLGPRVRVVGFSRFHLSNDFILVTPIGNLHVTLKRHYYEEAHHFPHKVCIIFLSLLMYTPTIAD